MLTSRSTKLINTSVQLNQCNSIFQLHSWKATKLALVSSLLSFKCSSQENDRFVCLQHNLPCKLTLYEQLIHMSSLVIAKTALDLSREAIKWQKATIRPEVINILIGKHDNFGLHRTYTCGTIVLKCTHYCNKSTYPECHGTVVEHLTHTSRGCSHSQRCLMVGRTP